MLALQPIVKLSFEAFVSLLFVILADLVVVNVCFYFPQ